MTNFEFIVAFHKENIANLKSDLANATTEKQKKAIQNKIDKEIEFVNVTLPDWKKLHENNKIKLPEYTLEANKNGEKTLPVELLKSILQFVKIEDLQKFTSNDFAKICAIEYGSTNTSVNGFEQALRGFAIGAKFEWLPATRASANQTAKTTIANQQAEIEALKKQLEALKNKHK